MSTTIDRQFEDNALKLLKAQIERALIQAAEPVIKQALQDIEARMRERLATSVIELLDRSYSVHNNRDILEIRVNMRGPTP